MPPPPPRQVHPFLRKFGFGPQLRRRQDGSAYLDYAFGAIIGVISGSFLFNEPLREHFESVREAEEERKASAPAPAPARAPAPAKAAADSK